MKKIKLNSMYGVFGGNNFEDTIDSFNYLMNEISKVENDIKDLKTSNYISDNVERYLNYKLLGIVKAINGVYTNSYIDSSPCKICANHLDNTDCNKCFFNGHVNGFEYGNKSYDLRFKENINTEGCTDLDDGMPF